MAEEEPKYCPQCRAPWVWGNDFCVQCGFTLLRPISGFLGSRKCHPRWTFFAQSSNRLVVVFVVVSSFGVIGLNELIPWRIMANTPSLGASLWSIRSWLGLVLLGSLLLVLVPPVGTPSAQAATAGSCALESGVLVCNASDTSLDFSSGSRTVDGVTTSFDQTPGGEQPQTLGEGDYLTYSDVFPSATQQVNARVTASNLDGVSSTPSTMTVDTDNTSFGMEAIDVSVNDTEVKLTITFFEALGGNAVTFENLEILVQDLDGGSQDEFAIFSGINSYAVLGSGGSDTTDDPDNAGTELRVTPSTSDRSPSNGTNGSFGSPVGTENPSPETGARQFTAGGLGSGVDDKDAWVSVGFPAVSQIALTAGSRQGDGVIGFKFGDPSSAWSANAGSEVQAPAPSLARFNVGDPTVTVTYNNNGGNVAAPDDDSFTGAQPLDLGTGMNKTIGGVAIPISEWNTQSDGEGISYGVGDTVRFTEDTTLWAVYESFTAILKANGSGENDVTQVGSGLTAIRANPFSRDGYDFAGWTSEQNGSGDSYADGANLNFNRTWTLWAQWTAHPTLTYNANSSQHQGGAVTGTVPTSDTQPSGTTITVATNSGTLARQGFTFDGWNTASDGSGTDYSPGDTFALTSNVTLYAQWSIPEAARLFGLTESSVRKESIIPVEDADGNSVVGNIRGITTDGSSIFFLPSDQASIAGIVREVGFDGVLIADHTVTGAGTNFQGLNLEQRDLSYSNGCIFIRKDGTTNSKLYCIDTTTWSMSEVTVPTQTPPGGSTAVGLLLGNTWLQGNLIDFPDGRIGAVSRANWNSLTSPTYLENISMTTGTGAGECPASHHCKILRLYTVSGSGSSATLSFSEDIVLADSESGWPSDDHGIATDGTYLYQSHHLNGYKTFALRSSAPSYIVFDADGTESCGADSGTSGGLCTITGWGKDGLTVANATFFGRDHVNKRYLMGDYGAPQFVVTTVATDQPAGVGTISAASAPRSVSASAGNAQATVSWQVPTSNGGGTISSYTVTATPGGATCSTATLSCTLTGLVNGTAYTFSVVALNNGGTSPAATSGSVTPGVPAPAGSGGTGGGVVQSAPVVAPATPATPRIITPSQPTSRPTILQGPVTTPGRGFDPTIGTRATIGGAPATVAKRSLPSGGLSVEAGAFQFGLNLTNPSGGGSIDSDNPSNTPELRVPTGQSTTFNGGGLLPGSQLQVWLPGPTGETPRELARVPVRADGTFETELSFTSRQSETPVPIGRQVMQVAGFDENGNQTVVDMTINVAQGPVAPERNQVEDALPDLVPGASLATSAGLPTPVTVIPLPEENLLTVGDGQWLMTLEVDSSGGAVEGTSQAPVIRMEHVSGVSASGNGFMPGTTASVWMFSDPTLMGTISVSDDGSFTLEFMVDPQFLPVGNHTLQVQGVGEDGFIKASNLGVLVEEAVSLTESSSFTVVFSAVGIFLGILAILLVVFLVRRKRA